jgi:hypothetical protein
VSEDVSAAKFGIMVGIYKKLGFEIPVFETTFFTTQFQDVADHGQEAGATWIDGRAATSALHTDSPVGKWIGA